MFDFLALPTEIRYEVYRHLRKYVSLRLSVPLSSFGYASYGFYPEILMTNHQISYEAKQVFYGENDCTYPYEYIPLSDCCPTYRIFQTYYLLRRHMLLLAPVYTLLLTSQLMQGHSMLVGTSRSGQIGSSLRPCVLRFHSYVELIFDSDCTTGCTPICLFREHPARLP